MEGYVNSCDVIIAENGRVRILYMIHPVYSWYCRCCGSGCVMCFSLSAHTSPYIYSSQLPLEVLTNVNMRVPVTANRVTCVTLGGDSEQCGDGALPLGPLLVERVLTKN